MRVAGIDFPDDLAYDRNNGWARREADLAVHGMTELGQRIADSIGFVGLPSVGEPVARGQTLASFESSKWIGRITSLVSGNVMAANSELERNPGLIHQDPYGAGWIAVVQMADPSELDESLSSGSPEFLLYVEESAAQLSSAGDD